MKKEKGIIQVILKSGLITWVLLLLIWQIGSLFYSDDFLPGPVTTFAGAGKLVASGDLFRDILISMQRVLKGWLLGILFAIPAGLCIGHFKKIGEIFEPFLNFFRFVPAIGFITLFLMWFGVGEKSKVALIFYAVIFPVMINTIAGVRTVDDALIEASESLGANGAKTFFTVIIPSAVPNIFTGVRLGLIGAIICIVAAEMLAASEGIGYLIYTSRLYYKNRLDLYRYFYTGYHRLSRRQTVTVCGKKSIEKIWREIGRRSRMLEKLTQDNYEKIIAGKDKPVVIDFFSPECRHCKMTEVGLLELAEEQKDAAVYAACDITEEQALAERFDITTLPTLLFIKNGDIKNKLTGFTHKLIIAEEIKKLV